MHSPSDLSETSSGIGYDAFDVETMSQLTQVLAAKPPELSDRSRYIVHTSTIPLASVVTIPLDRGVKFFHGKNPDNTGCMSNAACMFHGKSGFQHPQLIQDNCPCLEHEEAEHVCFLTVLSSIGHKLDPYGGSQPKFPLKDIMWCSDAQTIFDASYGNYLTKITGKKGWPLLDTSAEVLAVLEQLYWFKKNTPERFKRMILSRPVASLKSVIYNIIQTLDGLLLKLLFCFPLETDSYESLATRTSSLFNALLVDYFGSSEDGPSETYSQLKPFLQEVGLLFHSRDSAVRISIVDGGLAKYKKVNWFFLREMTIFRDNIWEYWSSHEIDLTESLSWKVRMAMFCKTRVLGHVPERDAYPSDLEFLKTLGADIAPVDKRLLAQMAHSVPLALGEEGVPTGGLREIYSPEMTKTLEEIVEEIDLDVKLTADSRHTRADGGKCESGRLLIDNLRKDGLKIPIRNLDDGNVVDEFLPPAPGEKGYKKAVFWASLQILTQDLSQRFPTLDRWESKWPEKYLEGIFDTEVVRINEPGKIRRLVKTSNEINASLAVGAHLLATQLAKGISHRSGMLGSNQTWNFEVRLDRQSDESAFLYAEDEKSLRPEVVCGFQDWSRASDFVPKQVGLTLLTAAHRFTAFPPWYSLFTQMTLAEPLRFRCHIFNTANHEFEVKEGWIRNGFMMGLQNTKNILHLIHYSAGFYAEACLNFTGWNRVKSKPYKRPIVRMNHEEMKSSISAIQRIRNDNG